MMPPTLLTEAASSPPKLSLGRILVVEDEDLIRDTIILTLSEEGYEVLSAADGREALEILQACLNQGNNAETLSLNLVILDLMLPYINGLDLCRLVRREGNSIPILMLSAKGTETDRVVGREVGADDYLTNAINNSNPPLQLLRCTMTVLFCILKNVE